MSGASQVGYPLKSFKRPVLILGACLLLATLSFGQERLGQTRLGVTPGGYPLPSVSSMGSHYLPYPLPSVSSIPNTGFGNRFHNGPGFNHGGRYRNGGWGWGYALPYYYIPLSDYGYDYDYVGASDMYSGAPSGFSGPPIGPNDQTLHIIVEQPPAQPYRPPTDDTQAEAALSPPAMQERSSSAREAREAKPIEPTVLVFRDGHQQQVNNYAIMGQMVYVLDDGTHKIPLANLDVPATVKANDDRGVEFNIPAGQRPAQKDSDLQPNRTPDQNPPPAANVTSALP
jgi:hypothetical protein